MDDNMLIWILGLAVVGLYLYAGHQQWMLMALTDPETRDLLPATLEAAEHKAAFLFTLCFHLVFWLPLMAAGWVTGLMQARAENRATGARR